MRRRGYSSNADVLCSDLCVVKGKQTLLLKKGQVMQRVEVGFAQAIRERVGDAIPVEKISPKILGRNIGAEIKVPPVDPKSRANDYSARCGHGI